MKKILLTGGAGYIGSVLINYLLVNNYKVTVLDNFMFNQNSLLNYFNNKNFELIKGDVRNLKILSDLIKINDIVIPLAGLVGAPICDKNPIIAEEVNLQSNLKLIDLVSKNQIILMPTTNSAYGKGDKNNYCNEETQLNPISIYAKHKVEVEEKLLSRENVISFRLATVFGTSPRMRFDLLVNDFTYRAVKDGYILLYESHFKRNYIHIRDVCRVFIHGLKNFDNMKSEIYNVGLSDANLSKKELCERIKIYEPNFKILEDNYSKDPDQRDYIVSNEKIEKTGFKNKHTIDDGILEVIKFSKLLPKNIYGNV